MNTVEMRYGVVFGKCDSSDWIATLERVVDRLCDTICSLSSNVISNTTGREWFLIFLGISLKKIC